MQSNSHITVQALGFSSVLTVAFIVLNLLDIIDWRWTCVLSPLWIEFGFFGIVTLCVLLWVWIRK